jgi:hypothetical protein
MKRVPPAGDEEGVEFVEGDLMDLVLMSWTSMMGVGMHLLPPPQSHQSAYSQQP